MYKLVGDPKIHQKSLGSHVTFLSFLKKMERPAGRGMILKFLESPLRKALPRASGFRACFSEGGYAVRGAGADCVCV